MAGMAGMVRGKALDFAQVMHSVREVLQQLPDARRGKNLHYRMVDAGLSAFSVFFMQSPSFLAHQRHFEAGHGRSNCGSLFGIAKIPSDNHIRDMLDDFERKDDIEPFFLFYKLFGRGGAVIYLQPRIRCMRRCHRNRVPVGIDAGHVRAQPRHRLAHQPAAAADIQHRKSAIRL